MPGLTLHPSFSLFSYRRSNRCLSRPIWSNLRVLSCRSLRGMTWLMCTSSARHRTSRCLLRITPRFILNQCRTKMGKHYIIQLSTFSKRENQGISFIFSIAFFSNCMSFGWLGFLETWPFHISNIKSKKFNE
ncbi:nitric oxide synthase oxygenase [Patescibacteria group bacterium]|nr:nitric oxide synthase oxygenase [Patescibacteria group bacterium]